MKHFIFCSLIVCIVAQNSKAQTLTIAQKEIAIQSYFSNRMSLASEVTKVQSLLDSRHQSEVTTRNGFVAVDILGGALTLWALHRAKQMNVYKLTKSKELETTINMFFKKLFPLRLGASKLNEFSRNTGSGIDFVKDYLSENSFSRIVRVQTANTKGISIRVDYTKHVGSEIVWVRQKALVSYHKINPIFNALVEDYWNSAFKQISNQTIESAGNMFLREISATPKRILGFLSDVNTTAALKKWTGVWTTRELPEFIDQSISAVSKSRMFSRLGKATAIGLVITGVALYYSLEPDDTDPLDQVLSEIHRTCIQGSKQGEQEDAGCVMRVLNTVSPKDHSKTIHELYQLVQAAMAIEAET